MATPFEVFFVVWVWLLLRRQVAAKGSVCPVPPLAPSTKEERFTGSAGTNTPVGRVGKVADGGYRQPSSLP